MTTLRQFQFARVDAPHRPRRTALRGRRSARTGHRSVTRVAVRRRASLSRSAARLLVNWGQLLFALWTAAALGFWVLIVAALVR